MAFNQGPQPDIIFNENGVRYIDPNPTSQTVNHEDLITYVKLVARSKGRSILTTENNEITIAENQFQNVKGETNFTYETGKSFLDSSWTNVGGGNLELGENLGTLGITNIDIQFKSSFMPQIVIDFVDIRGSALFEQGTCSPYSLFFHLPYPVFELTVKGYYGKPVTYTLALIKFNTKFNAETGNFESKAEFVGYTYAFLADLPIGYIMASTYMKEGREILVDKWSNVINKNEELKDEYYGLDPNKPITIYDLIRKSKKLETEVPKFKNSIQIKDLSKYNNAKQALNELNREINNFKRELIQKGCKTKSNNVNQKTIFYFESQSSSNIILSGNDQITIDVNEVIEKYLGDGNENDFKTKILGTKLEETNTYLNQIDLEEVTIDIDEIKENCLGLFGGVEPVVNSNSLYEKSIDLYYGLIENVNKSTDDLDGKYKKEKDETQRLLNERVRGILDFWPSVRNIFVVLTTNTEVFLELLARTSKNAEQYHINNPINGGTDKLSLDLKNTSTENSNTIYPWPTYYENTNVDDGDSGEKETYPGKNIKYIGWYEVRFVEDFIKALTELKDELKTLEASNLNNEPGFDNFAPITAFETHAFGEDKAPNRWLNIQNGIKGVVGDLLDSIYCVMGENAFLLGDYSMINSLSVWKSQLGFDYSWNGTTGPSTLAGAVNSGDIDKSKPNLGRWNGKGFEFKDPNYGMFKGKISPTTTTRMKQWGKVDALNMMSTLGSDGQTSLLTTIKANFKKGDQSKAEIKEKIKQVLKQKYQFKSQEFNDWKVGVTSGDVDLIDKQNIWNDTFFYVKKKGNPVLTLRGPIELSHSDIVESRISANPYNNLFDGVRLVRNSELEDRSINFSDNSLLEKLQGLYKEYFGDYNSKKDNNGEKTDNNSISVLTLKNRPRPRDKNKYYTPYYQNYTKNLGLNKKLKINDNLNMLTYNFDDFRTMFYYTQEDSKLSNYISSKTAGQALFGGGDKLVDELLIDLGSFRKTFDVNGNLLSSNFISSINYDNNGNKVRNTLLTQLPLWTLNYPPYKNPWYGLENYILHDEVVGVDMKTHKLTTKYSETDKKFLNDATNITRNFATWWGMNQYYRDDKDIDSNKYLLPLAYLTVMSFGFYAPNPNFTDLVNVDNDSVSTWTGHFPPFDGNKPTSVSSFSNFTHSHVVAETPKSWLLLLGSILWRAKEGGVLNNSYDNLQPTHTEGWNKENLSKGVNDDGDPVWFFHTPLSKPWWLGGSVFAIENPGVILNNTDINNNDGVTLKYQRIYLGEEDDGTDRWTSSVGSEFFTNDDRYLSNKPVVIGTWESGKNLNNTKQGSREILFQDKDSDARTYIKNSINGTNFSKTTQYEVPFLKPDSKLKQYEERPKTLTLKFDGIGEYINITKQMKELMFLPTSFKKELIKYFENWGSSDAEAFNEKKGWLTTLDPLNWETFKGLKYYKPNTNPLDWEDVGQLGYQGYLSESHTTGMLTGSIYGDVNKTDNKGNFQLNFIPNPVGYDLFSFIDNNNNGKPDTGDFAGFYKNNADSDSNTNNKDIFLNYIGRNLLFTDTLPNQTVKNIYYNTILHMVNNKTLPNEVYLGDTLFNFSQVKDTFITKSRSISFKYPCEVLTPIPKGVTLSFSQVSIEGNYIKLNDSTIKNDTFTYILMNQDTLAKISILSKEEESEVVFINDSNYSKNVQKYLFLKGSDGHQVYELNEKLKINLRPGEYKYFIYEDNNKNGKYDPISLENLRKGDNVIKSLKDIDIRPKIDVEIGL